MIVNVEMTDEEFIEFMDWKKNKRLYEFKEMNVRRALGESVERLAICALKALEQTENEHEFEIKSQEAAAELLREASEAFA